MDSVIFTSAVLTALATLVLAVTNGISTHLTNKTLRAQTDPALQVTIEQIQDGSPFFGLVLKNIGSRPAFNVTARVDPRYRPVDVEGVYQHVKSALSKTWGMVVPGQVVAFHLDRDRVYEERNSESRLIVTLRYTKAYSDDYSNKQLIQQKFDVTPTWVNGQLMSGPSVWREIDSRVSTFNQSFNQMQLHLASIARALDDKDDK